MVAVAAVLALAAVAASRTATPDVEREVLQAAARGRAGVDRGRQGHEPARGCRRADPVARAQVANGRSCPRSPGAAGAGDPRSGADPQPAVEMLRDSSTTGTIAAECALLEFGGGPELIVFVLDRAVPEQDPEACAELGARAAGRRCELRGGRARVMRCAHRAGPADALHERLLGLPARRVRRRLRLRPGERCGRGSSRGVGHADATGHRRSRAACRVRSGSRSHDVRVLDGFYVIARRGRQRVTELGARERLGPTLNVSTRPPYFWPITTWAVRARRS